MTHGIAKAARLGAAVVWLGVGTACLDGEDEQREAAPRAAGETADSSGDGGSAPDPDAAGPNVPASEAGTLEGGTSGAGPDAGDVSAPADSEVGAGDLDGGRDADGEAPAVVDAGRADPGSPCPSEAGLGEPRPIHVERIVDRERMPASENGVFTDSGRFFVVGGELLYEVVGGPDVFEVVELLHEDCLLNGLVDHGDLLYAACSPYEGSEAQLLRIDPRLDPVVVQRATVSIPPPMLLNGMEFGPDGALYISNSLGAVSGEPVLYRFAVSPEEPLPTKLTAAIATSGDILPNGLRFDGDDLYFSTGFELTRRRLQAEGGFGEPQPIYSSDEGVVDDFDLACGRLFLARTDSLDTIAVLLGGPSVGSPFGSFLIVTDLDGEVAHEVALDFIPSSTAARRDTLFGEAAVVVTSYFNGGLYRVTGLL